MNEKFLYKNYNKVQKHVIQFRGIRNAAIVMTVVLLLKD